MNKMEVVQWAQDRYDTIVAQVHPFLVSIGFNNDNIQFVPAKEITKEIITLTPRKSNKWKYAAAACFLVARSSPDDPGGRLLPSSS